MSNPDNILQIKNLTKHYGKHMVLNNVSLDIQKGKIIGLLGPNGSGKTTLIKIIMGLLSGYQGDVQIANYPPGHKANAHISYLPDRSHIPIWLTPNQAIALFADFYSDFDATAATETLRRMGISLTAKISTLSRGTQEKVQLALVMSRRASLYVLDEPIGAVDPAARDLIVNTILKNYPENSSILLSTHIISDIEPIIDTAIFLKDGEIFINGNADTIREDTGKSLDSLFREVFKNAY